jgi:DNA-binding IclR family transcriptional regulator
MPHHKTNASPYRAQVLDRAMSILNALAARQEELTIAELCSKLRLHKSTVHRLMMVLEGHRLVAKNPENGRYRLGLKLFELGSKAIADLDLRERSRAHLTRLLQETRETVHLCILDLGDVVYLEKMEPERSMRTASRVGARHPAYCTAVGKVLMSELPEADLSALLKTIEFKPRTARTIISPDAFRAELKRIRARGYALDDEEIEEGLRCVAAAVRDHSGRAIAAVSMSGPSFRMTDSRIPALAESVCRVAMGLSTELGFAAIGAEVTAGGAPGN